MNIKNKRDRTKIEEIKLIRKKIQAMVARVYTYFKEEYNFMKMCNSDGCNIQPLRNCKQRTAIATGTSAKRARLIKVEEKEVEKRSPTKILNEDDEDCLLIEDDEDCILIEDDKDERQNVKKRKRKELSPKKRIVKKIKKTTHTNTIEIETDISDSSTNTNSPSNENLIEISESDIEERKRLSLSSKSTDNEESSSSKSADNEESSSSKSTVVERSDQVNLSTVSDNSEEDRFPSTSSHQTECNIVFSSNNSVQQSTRQVHPNLQQHNSNQDVITVTDINKNLANDNEGLPQFLQLEDEVTENNGCVKFPSTCIKQEEFETLPLPTYRENVEEGLFSSIFKCKAEDTENDEQVNADTETYYMIQDVGFQNPSIIPCINPSINLEEYEVIPSSNTYMDVIDFNSDEGQLFSPKLDSVRKFQDKTEVSIDSNVEHVTFIEQGDYKILSPNKFAVNVVGKEEFECEPEINPLSNMRQHYYILKTEKEVIDVSDKSVDGEEIDVSDKSVDGEEIDVSDKSVEGEEIDVSDKSIDGDDTSVFEDLPSSSNSNLYKASETKDIEFVCVNEASSDSSD